MIGFNDQIAWGETNVGQDVEDLFLVEWADKGRTKYKLDGRVADARLEVRTIKVKNMDDVLDTIRYIDKGVVRMMSEDGKSDIAVRWLPVDPKKEAEFMTFINVMQAKNYGEFKKSIVGFNTPAQNFIFASASGDIALHVNGIFPLRQKEDGRFVESASLTSTDWSAMIPREQNPFIHNPNSGYVTSSNQRSAGSDYPYYYTGKFEHARNRVINDSLSTIKTWSVETMQQLQTNDFNIFASEGLPVILEVLEPKYKNHAIYKKLKNWNYFYTASDDAPTVYEFLFDAIYKGTFEEILQYADTMDVLKPEDWRLISLLLKEKNSELFDDIRTKDKVETMADVVTASFEAISGIEYAEKTGKSWGKNKPVDIMHYTRLPAFSIKGLECNGTPDAINAVGVGYGPSWRMVVDMAGGEKTKAFGVYPGGQSGNPLSPFYKNLVEHWATKKYYPLDHSSNKENIKHIKKIRVN
ncbi:MAG: penicillin acylase family protein [Saprospiraceae bacterium]|nr:penicillin acylase family protein [Saprospiraceae bacterium]